MYPDPSGYIEPSQRPPGYQGPDNPQSKVFQPIQNQQPFKPIPQRKQSSAPAPQPQFNQPNLPQNKPNSQGYTQTTAPYGVDMMNPGVGQQFWSTNQNLWMNSPTMDWAKGTAPGAGGGPVESGTFGPMGQGSQFWNQVAGNFNKASEDLTPQFNAYYDNARDSAVGAANKQSAARGVYGSSAALNNVGNVIGDVEAQRAKASTDFMFGNKANQLGALGAYGNMAFGAGREGLGMDNAQLARLNSGFSASGAAEQMRNQQNQGMFDNIFRQQSLMLPWAQGNYDPMLAGDEANYMGAYDAGVGKASDQAGYARGQQGRILNDAANGVAVATGVKNLMPGQTPPVETPRPPSRY